MCSRFCKVQRPLQAFVKAKMKLLSFTGFHYLVLYSCWNDKGTRSRDRVMCFVERRYNQLRGHWRQVAPRNVPMLGLNAESAINQLQAVFFLQNLPQTLLLVVSSSILLMLTAFISISGLYSLPCIENPPSFCQVITFSTWKSLLKPHFFSIDHIKWFILAIYQHICQGSR